MERIDAHVHLWQYRAEEFGWIPEQAAALRRDFLLPELRAEMRSAGVSGALAVQARRSLDETRSLLELARASEGALRGVVGWAPIEDAALAGVLREFADERPLRGLREIVEAEAAGWMDRPVVDRGMRVLTELGYTFDLLVRADQMEEAVRLVDRHPRQRFVLDHVGKPRIAEGLMEPWRRWLREMGRRENVACKLSGMATEARWEGLDLEVLRPYLDAVVEAFGGGRLMVGSDWPVCTAAVTYARWWSLAEMYLGAWSEAERGAVLGGNAVGWYGLPARG